MSVQFIIDTAYTIGLLFRAPYFGAPILVGMLYILLREVI
jgi:hypothetical protein